MLYLYQLSFDTRKHYIYLACQVQRFYIICYILSFKTSGSFRGRGETYSNFKTVSVTLSYGYDLEDVLILPFLFLLSETAYVKSATEGFVD